MLADEVGKASESAIEFVKNLREGEHGSIFFTSRKDFKNIQFALVKSALTKLRSGMRDSNADN